MGTTIFQGNKEVAFQWGKVLLIMDGYACNVLYKTLFVLKKSRKVVLGLRTHMSHVIKPLDVPIIGRLIE